MLSKIDELKERSVALTHGATAKAPTNHLSCNVIAKLEAPPDTQGDTLILQATPLFNGPHTTAGQTETFTVRPERVKECKDNLNKGVGGGPGSVLAFGNVWRDRDTGTLSVGWINTCISAQKVKGEMNHHQDRTVVQVYAQMPVLDFTNVHRAPGEPERVRWPLGLDRIEARAPSGTRWQTVAFERDWLKEKLEAAWSARAQDGVSVNLRLPVLRPEQALPVRDEAEAARALNALLSTDRYRSVLTRIDVGESVETRWQPLMHGENVAEWSAQLLSRAPGFDDRGQPVADPETGEQVMIDRFSLIRGINNDVLFEAARQGLLQIEFLPRDTVLVASKNAMGLANDIKSILQSDSAADLRSVAFAFGHDPEAVSRVALVLQQQDERTYVVAGPFRLDAGPAHSLATVPSPNLTWASSAPDPQTAPPLEPASIADIPALDEEDFALDGAALDAALEERPVASGSTDRAKPAEPSEATARPAQRPAAAPVVRPPVRPAPSPTSAPPRRAPAPGL